MSYVSLRFYANIALWEGVGRKKNKVVVLPFLAMETLWIGYPIVWHRLNRLFKSFFGRLIARRPGSSRSVWFLGLWRWRG